MRVWTSETLGIWAVAALRREARAATVEKCSIVANCSDAGARPRTLKRQGSVSVDAAYRAMPAHHTPTEFDAKGSSGQSAWAGMMPDAAAAPPTPVNRASKWPGWKK